MKYLVLRNCFTAESQYFSKGDTVELPDEMYKAEKNFRSLETPPTNATEPLREPKPGEYLCSKCSAIHRDSSKQGKSHLKHKQ